MRFTIAGLFSLLFTQSISVMSSITSNKRDLRIYEGDVNDNVTTKIIVEIKLINGIKYIKSTK